MFCRHLAWLAVSDCTAEAVSGILAIDAEGMDATARADAARFMMRCQNRDGGFGSYEAQKSRIGLEWLNPAEMFADSMTEHSFVECTASAIAAMAEIRDRADGPLAAEIEAAITRASAWLRRRQRPDGAWPAAWGVYYIYGTMFGIMGLRAAGAASSDTALRHACAWLKSHQRHDGSWGEHHTTCLTDRYTPHTEGQVIQTAWALRALLEAEDPAWQPIERGANWLAGMQREDGTWPRQDMAGVFFHTALLEYELYRSYFLVWALGLYETRRKARTAFEDNSNDDADKKSA